MPSFAYANLIELFEEKFVFNHSTLNGRGFVPYVRDQEQAPHVRGAFFVLMKFYIYILYSETSDIYYVGYSSDFLARLEQHNHSERSTFTSKHRPWTLKAVYFCCTEEAHAMAIEKFIKKQKSKTLIEKLISGEKLTGRLALLVRVPHVRDY